MSWLTDAARSAVGKRILAEVARVILAALAGLLAGAQGGLPPPA